MNQTGIEIYERELRKIKGAIIDGVIDYDKYCESKYKIAWFLKEAYSKEEAEEGYHIKEHYGQSDAYDNFFKNIATPTWHPIIYSSYGILNGFFKWCQLDYIRDKPEMCDVVKNIAIINANKKASLTGTYTLHENLNNSFIDFKKIIETQIKVLQPDILIFCNTFYLYKEYFSLTDDNMIQIEGEFESFAAYEKDGKLFLDVYHPANRSQKREIYVNQIISAAEHWAENKY